MKKLTLKVAWEKRTKLYAEGRKLCAEGNKLYAESDKLYAEGDLIWANAVIDKHGKDCTIEWNGKECILGSGEVFGE